MTLWFEKWDEQLVELSLNTQKSEKLNFDRLFLSKVGTSGQN